MARLTEAEMLTWRAKYQVGATVQVYTIFDGWQDCTITKLGWDHMYGRVQYHVLPVVNAGKYGWITDETCMKGMATE